MQGKLYCVIPALGTRVTRRLYFLSVKKFLREDLLSCAHARGQPLGQSVNGFPLRPLPRLPPQARAWGSGGLLQRPSAVRALQHQLVTLNIKLGEILIVLHLR